MFGIREHPDLPLVEECMDLFRQAAELYSAADDPRHEEVGCWVVRWSCAIVVLFRS